MADNPKNFTNLVFLFVQAAAAAALATEILYQAEVQESDADPLNKLGAKTIRVGSYDAGRVQPLPNGTMKEFDAHIAIEFVVKPDSQSLENRIIARETAHQMALAVAGKIAGQPDLNGACHAEVIGKSNGYRLIKDARHQVSILNLVINRKEWKQ